MSVAPPTPVYSRVLAMHAKLAKGGYLMVYNILRDGRTVGTLTSRRDSRKTTPETFYTHDGSDFTSLAEFKAAVEETIGKRADA